MIQPRSGLWSILVMLVAVSMIVTACQAGNQGGNTASDNAAVDPNGAFNTNMGSEPDTIDPQKESFVGEVGQTMMVFEALMALDPKTLKPIPGAAKDAPKVSADGLTYTYTLRDGLKYSDGSPLTVKDFAYAFTRLCDPNVGGDYAFTGYSIVGCEAYSTTDPKKATPAELAAAKGKLGITTSGSDITFKLVEQAPYFNSIAALWVGVPSRESDVTKGGDKWTEPATFIGNGPFKLTEWKHNEKMVYERNDNYRTPAKLKTWTKVMINEGAVAFAAYRNNELDAQGIAAEDLRTVNADPDLKAQVRDVPGSCTFYYGFNTAKPPFTDPKVRMAFAKSFDRASYVTDVAGGIGKPIESFLPPGLPGYDPTDHTQAFDVAAAKQLLASSTFAGKPELTGIKFTYSSSARNKTRTEWVLQQWKTNLGIDIAADPVASTTYTQLVKKPETTPQLFFLGWCADYPDQQDWLTTVFLSTATISHVGWANTQFDTLTRQADKEPDPKKRDDTYLAAQKILTADAPVAFIYSSATKYLLKPYVHGITDTALDFEFGIFDMTNISVSKKQ
ncbi:MAG TPA: ABC transporter substrate-binding protein [Chloroflexi bacterium]|jgi:oligopeptide transport system substrate-binding protein|nr:ABC transporter substrate-binding protein [Chloroflexota bacterium]HAL26555.1 ABC transporter substrate-binding protein [Chloroflexota bacterium]